MGLKRFLAVGFGIYRCPAPSIDRADGKKRADCLSAEGLPQAGSSEASFRVLRQLQSADVQGKAGHGVFFWLLFCHAEEK